MRSEETANARDRKWPLVISTLTWIWTLAVIGGVGYLVYWVFEALPISKDNYAVTIQRSVIVTSLIFILPQIFKLLDAVISILDSQSSGDHQRSEMYAKFMKIICLEMSVMIGMLVYYWRKDIFNSNSKSSGK